MIYAHPKTLAALGRNGDSLVGHLTPGDVVIPAEKITPEIFNQLHRILKGQTAKFTAGSPKNSINPHTNMPEFMEGAGANGGGGTGDSSGGAGGSGGSGQAGDTGVGGPGQGGLGGPGDPSGSPGANDTTGAPGSAGDVGGGFAGLAGNQNLSNDLLAAPSNLANAQTNPTSNVSISDPQGRGLLGTIGDVINAALASAGINVGSSVDMTSMDSALFGAIQGPGLNTNAPGTLASLAIGGLPGMAIGNAISTGLDKTGLGKSLGLNDPAQGLSGFLGQSLSDTSTSPAGQASPQGTNIGGQAGPGGSSASGPGADIGRNAGAEQNALQMAMLQNNQSPQVNKLLRMILPTGAPQPLRVAA